MAIASALTCALLLSAYAHVVSPHERPAKPELTANYMTITVDTRSEIGKCVVMDSYPIPNVTWYKNGKVLQPNGNDTHIQNHITKDQNTRLLTIESTLYYTARKNDMNARFFCEVFYPSQNEAQRSDTITIDVYYPIEGVTIEVGPLNDVIREGDTITLNCTADTNLPPEKYMWEKDGIQFSDSAQYTLQAVTKQDEGEYQCTVFDFDFNAKSASVAIQVRAREDNNELNGPGVFAEESHSTDHHGKSKSLKRAGMVIGIIVTLMLVAFSTTIAYYMCYHRKKTEKKPLEDLEEENALDPGIVPHLVEKDIREEP
ncbi:CD166 antigen-like [Scyliorhinus canicula]|uniref:CD166 antigen-like n=1 Tax=Scyliorhinus canicula TaxID=7830 RepID=UPI0018F2A525|nr:CD166 antigen-like [Scyliorhinus canicula]